MDKSAESFQGAGRDAAKTDSPRVPVRALRIAFLVLCTVGALLSADLLRLHIRLHTDPNYHSLCAISETLDCESVAFSKYAVAAGLPVALWGLVGYLVMGGLAIWGLRHVRRVSVWPFGTLFWLSLFSSLIGIGLFTVSSTLIHSVCVICIATYVVNFSLWGIATAELKRLKCGPFSALGKEIGGLPVRKNSVSLYVLAAIVLLVVLKLAIPPYWQTEITAGPGGLLTGRTAGGAHWIGARKPVIEIREFSDYQCPFCLRGHIQARNLVYEHPDQIRLVHLHYPLDRHPEAFQYSKLAYCAGKQGRFWVANDYLFASGRRPKPVTILEIASALEIDPEKLAACVDSKHAKGEIRKDVALGRELQIQGTPTFVIDGKLYPGYIPNSVLSPLSSKE